MTDWVVVKLINYTFVTDCIVVKLLFNNWVLYGLAAPCTGLSPKFTNQSINFLLLLWKIKRNYISVINSCLNYKICIY